MIGGQRSAPRASLGMGNLATARRRLLPQLARRLPRLPAQLWRPPAPRPHPPSAVGRPAGNPAQRYWAGDRARTCHRRRSYSLLVAGTWLDRAYSSRNSPAEAGRRGPGSPVLVVLRMEDGGWRMEDGGSMIP